MTFKDFAIDTLYRMGWTFTQALLACMTVGQKLYEIDWKGGIQIALVAMLIVLLKQVGIWCFEHINDTSDLPIQHTFNTDSYKEMMGVEDEETNNLSEEQ